MKEDNEKNNYKIRKIIRLYCKYNIKNLISTNKNFIDN